VGRQVWLRRLIVLAERLVQQVRQRGLGRGCTGGLGGGYFAMAYHEADMTNRANKSLLDHLLKRRALCHPFFNDNGPVLNFVAS
jgi:hypothetical protein